MIGTRVARYGKTRGVIAAANKPEDDSAMPISPG